MTTRFRARGREKSRSAHDEPTPTRPGAVWCCVPFKSEHHPAPLCPGLRGTPSNGAVLLLVCLFSFALSGCATEPADPPTLSTWQQNLQQYVWDHANGDPTVLADMSWDDVHKGFSIIGDPLPDRSTDEIGLLLAHRVVDSKPWFLFLLGTVRQQNLEDLRLVALSVDGNDFHWSVGPENDTSLSLYRVWSEADRERTGPQDPPAPPFPRLNETFGVTVRGDAFAVRHQESGANWELHPTVSPTTGPAR